MRFILFALIFVLPVSAHAEPCEGFTNGITALEAAISNSNPANQTRTYRSRRDAPPIGAINAAIDDLHEAVEKHNAQASPQRRIAPAQSYPRRQKPSL